MKKTASKTGLQSIILLSVSIMFILFLMPFASAWDWDNVKSYDTQTKTAIITNALGLGEKIADVKLKSETAVQVGLGYQKVFEYEVDSKTLYDNFIQETEIYNIKTGNTKESKRIDLKYLTYEDYDVNDYSDKKTCKFNETTKNETCSYELIGKHKEQREVWNDIVNMNVKIEKITISGWTDVKQGDYYEWIPNFAGVKVNEWATWTGNLSVGLDMYLKFEEANVGALVDSIGRFTFASASEGGTIAYQQTGKLGYGINFTGSGSILYANQTTTINDAEPRSVSVWTNLDTCVDAAQIVAIESMTGGQYKWFGMAEGIGGGTNYWGIRLDAGGTNVESNATCKTGWHHIVITYNGTEGRLYEDAVLKLISVQAVDTNDAGVYKAGSNLDGSHINGIIDEYGWWNRSLSYNEVQILYNSGIGCQYNNESCYPTPDNPPTITLNSPDDASTSNSYSNTFSCTGIDDSKLQNISFYVNGSLNQTNTSVFNNSATSFTTSLGEGYYNWTCGACDNSTAGQCVNATPRTITIDIGSPVVTLNSPINAYNSTLNSVDFNCSVTDSYGVQNMSLMINGILNETNTSGMNNTNYYFTKSLAEGLNNWSCRSSNIYKTTTAGYRNVTIDTTFPIINITSPLATLNYQAINTNFTLNWTAIDEHIDKCWYAYKGTNTTVTCSDNTTNINITDWFNKNLTFWANDTFGNYNSTFFNWSYRLFFISETYNSSVLEGSIQQFSTLLITNGTDITIANLSYNGTGYLGSISQSGNNFTLTKSLTTPSVTANTNMSFFWKVTQDGFTYNYTSKNQTLNNIGIDNCSVNGNVLYNFTIVDEKLQTEINETGSNSLAQINLQLYSYGTTTSILSFNSQYNQTNPFAVCLNNTFVDENYTLDAQIKYSAEGYETEYYHIQNSTISNSSFTTNITLYDLNTTDSQVFKLIYKDSSFLPVYDALIVIGRKYIDEGAFKNVEIPKTDVQGETVGHLVLNNVIYNFTIIKDNVILGTFDNMFAVCQTPLVTECVIEFNSFAGAVGVPNFDSEGDLEYDLGYISATRTVQTNFTIPSGDVSTVLLKVTKSDALGTDICTETLTSASGTLSCVLPASIGNSTIVATLYKNGYYKGWGSLAVNQSPTDIYGTSIMIILSIVILLTLGGVALSGNPMITVALLMVGVILMFALNLVANNGFIGATATILFFVIACILILIKGVKR